MEKILSLEGEELLIVVLLIGIPIFIYYQTIKNAIKNAIKESKDDIYETIKNAIRDGLRESDK